jgi:hypothetical protein
VTIPAYPLQWPAGWRRIDRVFRTRAKFGKKAQSTIGSWQVRNELSIAQAVERVRAELKRMGVLDDDLVISTNLLLRLDGLPRSGQSEPQDPGVAVYWTEPHLQGTPPRCMAIDRYDRVADNLAAVAATLEAMRAIERHGGAEILERAFTGFTALAHDGGRKWWDVLGCASDAPRHVIESHYLRRRSATHPDKGGDAAEFQAVHQAWEQAQEACRG